MAQDDKSAGAGLFLFLVTLAGGYAISYAVNAKKRDDAERWNRVDLPRLREERSESVMCLTCNHIQVLPHT